MHLPRFTTTPTTAREWCRWLAALVLCLGCCLPAWAVEHVIERAYVEDVSGRWSLDQAQAQPLQPFIGLLTKGYGKGVLWVRLRIDPALSGAAPTDRLYLRIRPIFLDDIRVFDEADGFSPRAAMGDQHPLSAQDEEATFYLLKLPAGTAPRDVWVRLQSANSRLAYLEVLDEATLRLSSLNIQLLGGICLALMSAFALLGLAQAIFRRDALNWSFACHQVVALLYGAISLGYLRLWTDTWWSAGWLDSMLNVVSVMYMLLVSVFSNYLLLELGPSKLRQQLFTVLNVVYAGTIAMQFFGHVELSLKSNVNISSVMIIMFWLEAIFHKHKTTIPITEVRITKTSVVVYFSLNCVFVYLVALPAIGLASAVEFSIYFMLFYSLLSGALMLGMLQYRAIFLMRQRETLLQETREVSQRADLERMQRLERERLIAMLGHELKTPLATLRMMLGDNTLPQHTAQQLSEPLHEINEVIERTVQTGQLESGAIDLRPVPCMLVDTVEKSLAHLAQPQRLHWSVYAPAEQLQVNVDPFLLGVVVRNLIDNALKYSPDESRVDIEISANPPQGQWRVEVCNPVGRAGFPDPDHVFEKYWRSPKAGYRSGSGQGLFIAWRLAQLMGGTLRYMPHHDSVCFRLELPFQAIGQSTGPA